MTIDRQFTVPANGVNSASLRDEIYAAENIFHVLADGGIAVDGTQLTILFRAQNDADDLLAIEDAALATVIAAHDGTRAPAILDVNVANHVKSEIIPTEGTRINFFTPNFADKTTWWPDAELVEDDTCQAVTDGEVYRTFNEFIVDACNFKVFKEDRLREQYKISVTINGQPAVEASHVTGGVGDYTVNYRTGHITLTTPTPGAVVVATYHKVRSSKFWITPDPGKKLTVGSAETLFSADRVMMDSVVFQPQALASIVAPQLGLPEGTYLDGAPTIYNSERDFITESNGSHPPVLKSTHPDAVGNPRMIQNDHQEYPWQYKAGEVLRSSRGERLQIHLMGDIEFKGETAQATLYCLSEDE